MKRQHIDVTAHTTAPASVVYALLRDGSTWPHWSPVSSFTLERPGETEPEGVGAIRVFRTVRLPKPVTSRERIVELVPDRRLSYTLLSGLAIRDYRADVDLEQTDKGTTIRWRSSFTAKVPGTGRLYRNALESVIRRIAAGLADHAQKLTINRPHTSP